MVPVADGVSGGYDRTVIWRASTWLILVVLLSGCGHDPSGPSQIFNLAGEPVDPLAVHGAKVLVFVFVRTDCPISNRYAPEMRRLQEKFTPQGVNFQLVYPDPDEKAGMIKDHLKAYGYASQALRDPRHVFVQMTGAQVTPEAVVFAIADSGPEPQLVYRGRIDDRYVDFGTTRPEPTTHDLERVLEGILAGQPISFTTTPAVGCYIADLKG